MKLLSWNVAGRTGVMDRQAEGVERRGPDLACLQEVRASTAPRWRAALAHHGLVHALDSFEVAPPRRLFNLTASRWELNPLPGILAPQPERVLGVVCESPWGQIEVWNAHIRPAPSNGLVKAETAEALFAELARTPTRHRILCGDLNTPRYESEEGETARRKAAHRLDHVMASSALGATYCDYVHECREARLSDHSAMETIFEPPASRQGHR